MSREQWGHGYHKGVEDALIGAVHESFDIADFTEKCLTQIWRFNQSKRHDRSICPVKELRAFLRLCGIRDNVWQIVYKYILHNEPYGCYISGHPKDEPIDDYIVLSDLSFLMEGKE